ncbi:MAG: HDIG domain-containing protein [Chthonomonas sp.]|nr:HDIG domain-containing protein [Chthonomonas sp.]
MGSVAVAELLAHPALQAVREIAAGTSFADRVWIVGGAVRDSLQGRGTNADLDLVTEADPWPLVELLVERGVTRSTPARFERFGTAMVQIQGLQLEFVQARTESYGRDSRKPEVKAATLAEDALRRDFTVNAVYLNLSTGELFDPTGGQADLDMGVLRTPKEPGKTFDDDPLRMLRAVRFRWKIGLGYAPGLEDAIEAHAPRLQIVSAERIREEFLKMLLAADPTGAMRDLMRLGLIREFAPELVPMDGCTQNEYHHLDVWEHTLLAVKNSAPDMLLRLSTLLHDVGKPTTRSVEPDGRVRFLSHEVVGADIAAEFMRRLRCSNDEIGAVKLLVRNHMRLGTASKFSASGIRRAMRDLGDQLERLFQLMDADAAALKPGVRALNMDALRARFEEVNATTPAASLNSPLSGGEIMQLTGIAPGHKIGVAKAHLVEMVLEGTLDPSDREAAIAALMAWVETQPKTD